MINWTGFAQEVLEKNMTVFAKLFLLGNILILEKFERTASLFVCVVTFKLKVACINSHLTARFLTEVLLQILISMKLSFQWPL